MTKRADLIALYAADLREKCGIEPDMGLLTQVTIACGPTIYSPDASLVAAEDPQERRRIRQNFLSRRLGLREGPELDEALDAAVETYGPAQPRKYRAVLYYLLTVQLGREAAFD
ncbi:DUF2853 family protein [Mesobaculum littorinae]|uniref:DUF2853 family protein n=1 Tax=Mesobaculum littorinae TaxID=2486419 RepID=A0A438AH01_9RHOB|nr:DUF2853 family protein [Mesobaculum littorinae]RVV97990.1 DUF2853 family protein [Mesobaculum littorinae]